MPPTLPHLLFPPRRNPDGPGLATVEQDSRQHHESRVAAIVLCPQGFRDGDDLDDFGVPDLTHLPAADAAQEVADAIERDEPDIAVTLTVDDDEATGPLAHLGLTVEVEDPDGR